MSPELPDTDDDEMEVNNLDTGQTVAKTVESDENKSASTYSGITPTKVRVRQYPRGHKGPFIVHIRQDKLPLKHLQIARDLNSTLKSIQTCEKKSPSKITVTLLDIDEANSIPSLRCMSNYHAYIPAEDVEVEGVFELPPEVMTKEILVEGAGKFSHPDIPSIRPLDLFRFKRTVTLPNGETMEQDSNSVKVTFPGKALPRYMLIYNLLIKIRPYDRRAMFCNNCSSINHTEKFCTRKTCCLKCGQGHMTKDCSSMVEQTVCKLCKETHPPDIRKCPKFMQASKGRKVKQTQSIRTSYADMVRQYSTSDGHSPDDNRFSWLADQQTDEQPDNEMRIHSNPYKRQRSMNQSESPITIRNVLNSPTRRKTTSKRDSLDYRQNSSEKEGKTRTPPGFRKPGEDPQRFVALKGLVLSIVDSLDISSRFSQVVTICINLFFDNVLPFLIQNVFSSQEGVSNGR